MGLCIPGAARADTYSSDTTLALSSPAVNFTILAGSVVSSLAVNAGSVVVTVPSGNPFMMTSAARSLSYTGQTADAAITVSCSAAAVATIEVASSNTSNQTLTIAPGDAACIPPSSSSSGNGGGGYAAPNPTAPAGGFTATAGAADARDTTMLRFGYGDDITRIAISDNADFAPATYVNATSSIAWTVPSAKTLYVKYCNRYGKCSDPVAVRIAAAVDARTPAPPAFVSNAHAFYANLSYGMTHPDVRELQRYLNAHGFAVAQSGPGSPGNETTYFGLRTKTVLIKFQEAHASDILAPSGLKKGTGYFGPSTRAFVNT